jgi:Na+-transporting methylmalonyl-CoA/oxaloacetate decarboxylase gamma subunit
MQRDSGSHNRSHSDSRGGGVVLIVSAILVVIIALAGFIQSTYDEWSNKREIESDKQKEAKREAIRRLKAIGLTSPSEQQIKEEMGTILQTWEALSHTQPENATVVRQAIASNFNQAKDHPHSQP